MDRIRWAAPLALLACLAFATPRIGAQQAPPAPPPAQDPGPQTKVPPAAPSDGKSAPAPDGGAPAKPTPPPAPPPEPRGLRVREPGALPGFTLIAPLRSTTSYLVDLDGKVVHAWKSGFNPGAEYFQDNGDLLRCCQEPGEKRFTAGGHCGRLQEFAWDGSLVWEWKFQSDDHLQHHDIVQTPHGTILFIAYEYKPKADCIAAGRHPAHVGKDGMWSDFVVEIAPQRPGGAEIIWEWHAWDHLIQDIDKDADNYGNVAEHPERLDINWDLRKAPPTDAQVADMKALGYIAATAKAEDLHADWLHTNAIDYNAELDQIVLSSPHLSEIWILDHSTTSDEAASHAGGNSGHGGDLLYRYGNPKNYGGGTAADQKLFGQHNIQWIPKGLPGEGHLMVFNNGGGRPDGDYSSILEFIPPRKGVHDYVLEAFAPAGPDKPVWSYRSQNPKEFFSPFISGAQRLPNGNTLICEGARGRVFEVTSDGRIVWDYLQPFDATDAQGQNGPPNALFRATRIPADHPGLKGRELAPLKEFAPAR
jgi:hypothetical protein